MLAPVVRRAGRVVVLDARDRVLLVQYVRGSGQRFWATPGGGLIDGESFEDGARRELSEEVGLEARELRLLFEAEAHFTFGGRDVTQVEQYFLYRLDGEDLPSDAESESARMQEGIIELRWFTFEELERREHLVFPENLATELRRALLPPS